MLIPPAVLAELGAALEPIGCGLQTAVVPTGLDPLAVVRAGAPRFRQAWYFASPGGRVVAGLGSAWVGRATGPARFRRLDRRLAALPAGIVAALGFAFDPGSRPSGEWQGFPAAIVAVPAVMIEREEGKGRLVMTVGRGTAPATALAHLGALVEPGPLAGSRAAGPPLVGPRDEWLDRVSGTLALIRRGSLSKVVLARAARLSLAVPLPPFDLADRLTERFPGCWVYGRQAGRAAFVGASPELLMARRGGRFETRPLAGSAPRSPDLDEDARLGAALSADPKQRAEHAFLVDDLVERLRPFASSVERPPAPVVARLPGVQHLCTPLSGSTDARLLELVGAVHPTPAVGGVPRAAALARIAEAEDEGRGWYAGGLGWAEPGGDGEVALALRGVLLRGRRALLQAGAGIVAGSDPRTEAAEIDLKMAALLNLLGAS